jgi:hypothetical protein
VMALCRPNRCVRRMSRGAIVLACQKERGPARGAEAEVGVRVIR